LAARSGAGAGAGCRHALGFESQRRRERGKRQIKKGSIGTAIGTGPGLPAWDKT